jgi:DNA polymerase III sliding clamp (beta) subunit (PCNA family)
LANDTPGRSPVSAYERVIPKGNDKKIEFERDRLGSAVRFVEVMTHVHDPAGRLTWRDGGD